MEMCAIGMLRQAATVAGAVGRGSGVLWWPSLQLARRPLVNELWSARNAKKH